MTAWLSTEVTPAPAAEVSGASPTAPPPPGAATTIFGDRLALAVRYVDLLASAGLERGLLGPREVPRLWDRHLLNCAVVGELIPQGGRVLDVGSGAGLPGIALAIARPDLSVTLLEPMARRAAFLEQAVRDLGLDSVEVRRGRAEEKVPQGESHALVNVVTARAVAPLERLVPWCLPLVERGGRLLAIKGSSAPVELGASLDAVRRAGGRNPQIRLCGDGIVDPPTTVVEIVRSRERSTRRRAR